MRRIAASAALGLALTFAACHSGGSGSAIERAEDRREPDSDVLRQALAAGDPAVRERAALAMGRIQHPSYTAPLVQALDPGEPLGLRLAALFALGQQGLAAGARPSEDAVRAASRAAGEPDTRIVAAAVEALGKLAEPSSAGLLASAMQHPDPSVRAEAAAALFRLRFVPVWRGQADAPPPLPDDAAEALIGALTDPSPDVRRAAAHAFSRYAEPRALTLLMGALSDDDEWVRLFAVRALGRIADPAAAGALLAAISDGSAGVRTAAVDALAAVGEVARLPPVVLFDESFHVRAAIARAWGAAQDEGTLEFLGRLTQDPSPTVKAAAIEALALRLGDAYIVGIDFHMKHADWRTRAAAARATASMPDRGLEYALQAWADPDVRVRTAGLAALSGRGGVRTQIVDALGADDLALRGTAVGLIAASDIPDKIAVLSEAYAGSTGDDWIEVRESIVDAVAEIDPASPWLTEVGRGDAAASVRARARLALEKQGGEVEEPEPAPIVPSRLLGQDFAEDPVVVLETAHGVIQIRCNAAGAPVHTANFVQRVRDKFYDGLPWHRVVSSFVIQGGDPRGDGWGSGGVVLRDEINRSRFIRGAVGMPKAGKDTGGCQIFITHLPTPHLDGNYTVFGQVISGMEAVDAIEVGDTIRTAYVQ